MPKIHAITGNEDFFNSYLLKYTLESIPFLPDEKLGFYIISKSNEVLVYTNYHKLPRFSTIQINICTKTSDSHEWRWFSKAVTGYFKTENNEKHKKMISSKIRNFFSKMANSLPDDFDEFQAEEFLGKELKVVRVPRP